VRQVRPSFGDVFELRVSLRDIEPAVWRSLRVPADVPIGVLHDVIQLTFGWKNYHLHEFFIDDIRFGPVDDEDEIFCVDELGAPLGAVARLGATFRYLYDFGDDWEHDITVEALDQQAADHMIRCTGGARACPPEDSGGAHGYAELLALLAQPDHEEYAATKRWVGRGFDPEKLDLAAANKRLATLSKKLGLHKRMKRS
jgi:hypothetical protein